MIKLFRWLAGYIEFAFIGGFNEGFISDCKSLGYNLHNIKSDGGRLIAICPTGLYPYLRPLAKKHGGRLDIIKKRGLYFHLRPLRKRWGLMLGAVFAVAALCILSSFVWQIDIKGCEKISENALADFLEENGLYTGSLWKREETDRLESLVMAGFKDCAWIHINKEGTTVTVEISEAVPHKRLISKKPGNLIAKKDGRIISATVYDGWAVAKKGDSVVQGDLLISGVYESETGKQNLFAHARGEYLAEVKENISLSISREQPFRQYEYEQRFHTLRFFCFSIPLYIPHESTPNGVFQIDEKYAALNGNSLPLGIITTTVRVYSEQTRLLNDRELGALAEKEKKAYLKKNFKKDSIISEKTTIALTSESAEIKGYVICVENIGREVKLIR